MSCVSQKLHFLNTFSIVFRVFVGKSIFYFYTICISRFFKNSYSKTRYL